MSTKIIFNNECIIYHEPLSSLQLIKNFIQKSFRNLPQDLSLSTIDQEGYQLQINHDSDLKYLAETQNHVKIYIKSSENMQSMSQSTTQYPQQTQQQFRPFFVSENTEQSDKGLNRHQIKSIVKEELKNMIPQISKIIAENNQNQGKQEKAVHQRYICDGCEMNPIVGVRYKSSGMQDFDFCEHCEATKEHPYPFLKIKSPEQNHQQQSQRSGSFQDFIHNFQSFPQNSCSQSQRSGSFQDFTHNFQSFPQNSCSIQDFFKVFNSSFRSQQNGCNGNQWQNQIKQLIHIYQNDTELQNQLKNLVQNYLSIFGITRDQEQQIKDRVKSYLQIFGIDSDLQNQISDILQSLLVNNSQQSSRNDNKEEQQSGQSEEQDSEQSKKEKQNLEHSNSDKVNEYVFVFSKAKQLSQIFGENVESYFDFVQKNINLSVDELVNMILNQRNEYN